MPSTSSGIAPLAVEKTQLQQCLGCVRRHEGERLAILTLYATALPIVRLLSIIPANFRKTATSQPIQAITGPG
jgi:hypothetical protein